LSYKTFLGKNDWTKSAITPFSKTCFGRTMAMHFKGMVIGNVRGYQHLRGVWYFFQGIQGGIVFFSWISRLGA